MAAPPYETEASLTSFQFVNDEVVGGWDAEITGTWELPDNPTTPAGFTVDLPPELQGLTDTFPLLDPDGVAMGQCVVTATQIVCDFDDTYLQEHPLNLSGTFNFWAHIRDTVDSSETQTFYIEGEAVTVVVNPQPGVCTVNCDFEGRPSNKTGTYDRNTDTIMWVVRVGSDADGATGGEEMSVADQLGPNQEMLTEFDGVTYPNLRYTNELVVTSEGVQQPGNWVDVPSDQYTVNNGTVSWTAEAGYYYSIRYVSKATDGGASGTYKNDATVTVGGVDESVGSEVESLGGGGTGVGDSVGNFSITKDVVWEDQPVAGLEFTGTYTVTSPASEESTGTFAVEDGATWTSGNFVTGSTVHIDEILPTDPANITWAEPVLSSNDFVVGDGTTTAVTLTNAASLVKGKFSASKKLAGDAASDVPSDAKFMLDYSYPAGPGFAAGSGTLELPADGTVVTSPELPVGAQLALSERAPAAIEGAVWKDSVLSTDALTIGADEVVSVTVTNTIDHETVTPPTNPGTPGGPATPQPPNGTGDHTLATTGGAQPLGLLAFAGALIVIGAVTARRARTATR
ncbi:DUF5979 domain-containing protein [Leucobacter sp. NPDC058333]|uniref:DUF5979 domain-containing protein n=1 Tax=Leucobacter sp. NPDC058333 TaxID=3346450 RepID=UPI00364D394A